MCADLHHHAATPIRPSCHAPPPADCALRSSRQPDLLFLSDTTIRCTNLVPLARESATRAFLHPRDRAGPILGSVQYAYPIDIGKSLEIVHGDGDGRPASSPMRVAWAPRSCSFIIR